MQERRWKAMKCKEVAHDQCPEEALPGELLCPAISKPFWPKKQNNNHREPKLATDKVLEELQKDVYKPNTSLLG